MVKLTQLQSELLRAASQAADGSIDAPEAAGVTVASLIKRGLILSTPRSEGPSRLLITEAGRAAIASIVSERPAEPQQTATPESDEPPSEPKGKIGVLIALLRQPQGATVDAMMAATGWQAHSVRGAISGSVKKKLGHVVSTEKAEAGRVYRIVEEAGA